MISPEASMKLFLIVIVLALSVAGCGDKQANASGMGLIQCKPVTSKVELVFTDMCPNDANGVQMFMVGAYKENNQPRSACASMSWSCSLNP